HQSTFNDGTNPEAGLENLLSIPGTGPAVAADIDAPVFSASETDAANFEGCNAWSGTPFSGGVLLVSRGSCNFSVKVDNAEAAGAIAVMVHNNADGPPISMAGLETTNIPAVMIPRDDGLAATTFIGNTPGAEVTIPAAIEVLLVEEFGNVLAAGSLKGPNLDFDVTEPTINAPGTQILAANAAGGSADFRFLSGTSMSGPHIAGAGLLLMSEHPEWTPTEALSALMMTADPVGSKPGGAGPTDPDDVGSGTADLTQASLAGLVMNETFDNFLAANPANGGDPRTLNLPSMRHSTCDPGCSWTRTVRAARNFDTSWTATVSGDGFDVSVSPTTFDLLDGDVIFRDGAENGNAPNSSFQEIQITVSNNTAGNLMRFGELILTEDGAQTPDARMTISVSQSPPSPPPPPPPPSPPPLTPT
ncbi:MAG: PA domain-containing protein, partial [Wenzhouxiangellaceae bacterium]